MATRFGDKAQACCRKEKERIVDELSGCDAGSADSRHRCYRSVARKSGERSKQCMLSG